MRHMTYVEARRDNWVYPAGEDQRREVKCHNCKFFVDVTRLDWSKTMDIRLAHEKDSEK